MEIQNFNPPEIDRATPWHQLRDQRILIHRFKKGEINLYHCLSDGSAPCCCQCGKYFSDGQRMITVQRARTYQDVVEIHYHEHCFRHPQAGDR
jgi:hypothetical protein